MSSFDLRREWTIPGDTKSFAFIQCVYKPQLCQTTTHAVTAFLTTLEDLVRGAVHPHAERNWDWVPEQEPPSHNSVPNRQNQIKKLAATTLRIFLDTIRTYRCVATPVQSIPFPDKSQAPQKGIRSAFFPNSRRLHMPRENLGRHQVVVTSCWLKNQNHQACE